MLRFAAVRAGVRLQIVAIGLLSVGVSPFLNVTRRAATAGALFSAWTDGTPSHGMADGKPLTSMRQGHSDGFLGQPHA